MVDPFVIYNLLYSNLRECVSGAVYGKQMQQLKESTEVETTIVDPTARVVRGTYCVGVAISLSLSHRT